MPRGLHFEHSDVDTLDAFLPDRGEARFGYRVSLKQTKAGIPVSATLSIFVDLLNKVEWMATHDVDVRWAREYIRSDPQEDESKESATRLTMNNSPYHDMELYLEDHGGLGLKIRMTVYYEKGEAKTASISIFGDEAQTGDERFFTTADVPLEFALGYMGLTAEEENDGTE